MRPVIKRSMSSSLSSESITHTLHTKHTHTAMLTQNQCLVFSCSSHLVHKSPGCTDTRLQYARCTPPALHTLQVHHTFQALIFLEGILEHENGKKTHLHISSSPLEAGIDISSTSRLLPHSHSHRL